jgi:hypothetical protein
LFVPFGSQPRDSWWGQQINSSCASSRSWNSSNWCTRSPANYVYVEICNSVLLLPQISSPRPHLFLNSRFPFCFFVFLSIFWFCFWLLFPFSYIGTIILRMIQQWFKRELACPSSLCNLSLLEPQRRLLMLLAKPQRPSWILSLEGSSPQRTKMTVELIEWKFNNYAASQLSNTICTCCIEIRHRLKMIVWRMVFMPKNCFGKISTILHNRRSSKPNGKHTSLRKCLSLYHSLVCNLAQSVGLRCACHC